MYENWKKNHPIPDSKIVKSDFLWLTTAAELKWRSPMREQAIHERVVGIRRNSATFVVSEQFISPLL